MGIFATCSFCKKADDCMYHHGHLICDDCERLMEDDEDDFCEEDYDDDDIEAAAIKDGGG